MKKIGILIVLLCSIGYSSVNAQSMSKADKIAQVYTSYTSSLPAEAYTWLENCIDRVTVVPFSSVDPSIVKPLSDIPLLDKYGATLEYDEIYNEATFNPLKYMFNFTMNTDQYYRIGNSESVIKVNKID